LDAAAQLTTEKVLVGNSFAIPEQRMGRIAEPLAPQQVANEPAAVAIPTPVVALQGNDKR
jgi:hypothetical protein